MEGLINIYELIDPRTGLPRYVGQTKFTIEKRLTKHLKDNKNSYKVNWIKSLKINGLIPVVNLIESVPFEEYKFWEKYWISQYRTWGFGLVNLTEGGDGVVDLTGEIGRKIGAKQRGVPNKPISEEIRQKIRLSQLGKKRTPEQCENIRIAQRALNKKNSIETRTKISLANKGNKRRPPGTFYHSDKTKKLIGDLQRGKKQSLELIAKRTAGLQRAWDSGKREVSLEHKELLRQAAFTRHLNNLYNKIKIVL